MVVFLLRRAMHGLLVVIGVVSIVFGLAHIDEQNQARVALGPKATELQVTQFDHSRGFDQPLWRQFDHYVTNVARGNLGYASSLNEPVASLIRERLPKTALLVVLSTGIAIVASIALASLQSLRSGTVTDGAISVAAYVIYAMPAFLIGAILIRLFAFRLHWLPGELSGSTSVLGMLRDPRALVLPVLTLAAVNVALYTRYTDAALADAMRSDYVRTARAKGVSSGALLTRHALRNSLTPLISVVGLTLPAVVSGALVVEALFNLPGMGLLAYHAALAADVPLVLGCAIAATVATVIGSLLADITYAIVDPRLVSAV